MARKRLLSDQKGYGLEWVDAQTTRAIPAANRRAQGPIVPGQYRMNSDSRPEHAGRKFWRLEPVPKVPGWKCGLRFGLGARCGFEFHPGSMSLGCITADKTDPELMKQYAENNALLLSEDGSNLLTVVP